MLGVRLKGKSGGGGIELLRGDLPREKPKQLSKHAVFQGFFFAQVISTKYSSQLNANFATR